MHRFAQTAMVVALSACFGLGLSGLAQASETAAQASQTRLTVETREVGGRTVAIFTATAVGEDGRAAGGTIMLIERGKSLAGAALSAEGVAQIKLDGLTAGDHLIRGVYSGDSVHAGSKSESLSVHPLVTGTPDFALTISPASLTVAAPGDAANLVATITPSNGFTGFISLSCSGTGSTTTLPVGVTCAFAPANLQVSAATTANPTGAANATMGLQTSTGQQTTQLRDMQKPGNSNGRPLVLAVLLPGMVGLGFLTRKRKVLGPLSLLLMVGAVSVLGTTACSARYYYLHHGPTFGGTVAGSYTINVTAQTSNGVTAVSHTVPLALTVK
jgi:hypothetical protein